MGIQFSRNDIWTASIKNSSSWAEEKFKVGWQKWEPSFISDFLTKEDLKGLLEWAKEIKLKSVKYLIVIGMGGSSIGAKAIHEFGFFDKEKLLFWEGSHPWVLKKYSKILENQGSALLWISKSGTTLESRVNLALVREFFPNALEYFITSNPDKIKDINPSTKNIFQIPKNLGGRFSVISPAGIMPLLFLDAPMDEFLNGFRSAVEDYHISIQYEENIAKKTAYEFYTLLSTGYQGVIFWIYAHELLGWGDWIVQLWGESLGKNPNVKALPYSVRGPEDQHSLLQFFQEGPDQYIHIFCHTKSYAPFNTRISNDHSGVFAGHTLWEILNAQMQGIELSFTQAKRPLAEYIFSNIYKDKDNKISPDLSLMGKWMSYWMYVVSYLCYLYEVNPFDQPGVEKGKAYCKDILETNKKVDLFKESIDI